MTASVGLSPEELLHLAILDSRNGRHDEAIIKLKQCIAASPSQAAAYHMLAAEHAEIGMFAEAIEELGHAIQLDPNSVAARFQLGLLHALSSNPARAREEWRALNELDPTGPWNAFKKALECLLDGDSDTAIKHFESGLRMDIANSALRNDMANLRDRVIAERNSKRSDQGERQTGEMLLKTYRGAPEGNDS